MLFMVIERFRNPPAVHDRFAQRGRMLPEGVFYHASWIDPAQARCFQLMEAGDAEALHPWIARWNDLVDFDVIPVMESAGYWASINR